MLSNEQAVEARLTHMRLRGLASGTLRVNRDLLRRLAAFLLPTLLLAANPDDLTRWALHLSHLAPRTRYAELSRTHGFYVWAHDTGLIGSVPSARLPRPKVPRALPRPITEDRLAAALAAAPADIYTWLVLAAYGGLRCCEIATLTRDAVMDTADPPVMVITGKGAKDRVVPLHPAVTLALRAYGMPSGGWVFRRRDGRAGHPSADRVSWLTNRFLHEQGIPDTMHSLRHWAVTQVYRGCSDIRVAQTFAGHSSPQTTAGYAAYCPDRLRDAVVGIPALRPVVTLDAGRV